MKWILYIALAWSADPSLEVRPMTFEELDALGRQEAWSELVLHLKDVPPDGRNARWDSLVEKAALGHLDIIVQGAPAEGDSTAKALLSEFPSLRRSRKFLEKRRDATFGALRKCYENPFIEDECGGRLLDFVKSDAFDSKLVRQAAGIAAEKESTEAALPFLAYSLEKGADRFCREEFWQKAVLSGLVSEEASVRKVAADVASGRCWTGMRVKLGAELDRHPSSALCAVLKEKKSLTPERAKKCPAPSAEPASQN